MSGRGLLVRGLAAALAVLWAGVAFGAQAPLCPWISQGTAAALLGGDVEATVEGDQAQGECVFTRREGAGNYGLRVSVGPAGDGSQGQAAECSGARVPLRGVGGEAFVCGTRDGALVTGTVRKREFRTSISGPAQGGAGFSASETREKVIRAAEQVAGSLF
jgi:hypothetical protein